MTLVSPEPALVALRRIEAAAARAADTLERFPVTVDKVQYLLATNDELQEIATAVQELMDWLQGEDGGDG